MPGKRFFRRGISKVRFAPEIVDMTAPTRAEIDGSIALSVDVNDISGFQLTNSPIDTPDLDSAFTTKIGGEDTVADSSLTFHDRNMDAAEANAIRVALAKGTEGFILLLPYGDVPTKRMEVWPVTSLGVNDQYTMGNESAKFVVPFATTGVPEQDVDIPAAV